MEKEVETWDSALFTGAIRSATIHHDRDDILLEFDITSGMFCSLFLLEYIYDIVIVVSQQHLLRPSH